MSLKIEFFLGTIYIFFENTSEDERTKLRIVKDYFNLSNEELKILEKCTRSSQGILVSSVTSSSEFIDMLITRRPEQFI